MYKNDFIYYTFLTFELLHNKAIVVYTSPALCTPVTPFPPIGDAAYRQRAGGGSSHGHRQQAKKLGVKIARVVPEISSLGSLTDRQTHRQTYSSHYFATMLELLTDAALRPEEFSCGDSGPPREVVPKCGTGKRLGCQSRGQVIALTHA